MGNAYGNNEMHGDGAGETRDDLVADGLFAAARVGNHKQPLPSVESNGGDRCADTRVLERDRHECSQAQNAGCRDRESDRSTRASAAGLQGRG
jgi:hypothetical protein